MYYSWKIMERINKPWVWYEEVFSETRNYKCKRLYVNPDSQFSLQYHDYRNEYWTVVQGDGEVTVGENKNRVKVGDFIFVPRTTQHRIKGGEIGMTIIEIQIGEDCVEDDIVRLEDDYGRVSQ
jgi:mannose-1-phosphate guanylyltransferase/mannose-6-phosphate isomerase